MGGKALFRPAEWREPESLASPTRVGVGVGACTHGAEQATSSERVKKMKKKETRDGVEKGKRRCQRGKQGSRSTVKENIRKKSTSHEKQSQSLGKKQAGTGRGKHRGDPQQSMYERKPQPKACKPRRHSRKEEVIKASHVSTSA